MAKRKRGNAKGQNHHTQRTLKARVPSGQELTLSAKAASAWLGIPYVSLRDATMRGELAVLKLGATGSRWYFRRSDLLRWLDSRTTRFA